MGSEEESVDSDTLPRTFRSTITRCPQYRIEGEAMKRLLAIALFSLLLPCLMPAQTKGKKADTPHLAFVTEYVRELAAIEDIRASGEQELKQGTKREAFEVFSTAVHTSTLMQLELRSQIRMLKGMHLNAPFDELIPNVTAFYEQKIGLHQKLIDISSAFLAGPKPGADYGKMRAEVPKIRAGLEYLDKALFEATPLIFATLIDERPDSKNHANHLIITKAEKAKLIDDLTGDFGSRMDEKGQNYTVSAASVLKAYLLKDFKCSDEPWE